MPFNENIFKKRDELVKTAVICYQNIHFWEFTLKMDLFGKYCILRCASPYDNITPTYL